MNNLLDYLKTHYKETISYIMLIFGIMLLFFATFYGQLIVGLVTGIYFGDDLVAFLLRWKNAINTAEIARNLIIAGVAIAFFISAPAIFLGLAFAIGIKQMVV